MNNDHFNIRTKEDLANLPDEDFEEIIPDDIIAVVSAIEEKLDSVLDFVRDRYSQAVDDLDRVAYKQIVKSIKSILTDDWTGINFDSGKPVMRFQIRDYRIIQPLNVKKNIDDFYGIEFQEGKKSSPARAECVRELTTLRDYFSDVAQHIDNNYLK